MFIRFEISNRSEILASHLRDFDFSQRYQNEKLLKITLGNASKINNSFGDGIKIYRLFKGKISNLDEFLNSQEGNNKIKTD